MRSARITFRVTFRVYDELKHLCHVNQYKNISRCMKALCIMAIQDERRKRWVRELANANPIKQDYVLDKMMAWPLDLDGIIKMVKGTDDRSPRNRHPRN